MNQYICGINIILGTFQVHGNDHTHFCVFMSGQKWYFGQQTLGATELIHGMNTQLDFGSNIGGIPSGYTFFSICV